MNEQDGQEKSPGATRSQAVVFIGAADAHTMSVAIRPGVERSRGKGGIATPVCLIITPSPEQAITAAVRAQELLSTSTSPDNESPERVVPVTAPQRARRILASAPVAMVSGTAAHLLELQQNSALNLSSVEAVIVIGLDEILAIPDHVDQLYAILSDVPREATRVATLEAESESIDTFLEAQFRRARRVPAVVLGQTPLALVPRFILSSPGGRPELLRLLLDEQDPPSLTIVVSSEAGVAAATQAVERLGLSVDGETVEITSEPGARHVALTVIWEAPASFDALAAAVAMRPVDAVAMLEPEDLPTFRALTGGLTEAWTPAARPRRAGDRVQQLRDSISGALARGAATAGELAVLTPLLASHDAVELAAAALRLYEQARREIQVLKEKPAFTAPAAGRGMGYQAAPFAPAVAASEPRTPPDSRLDSRTPDSPGSGPATGAASAPGARLRVFLSAGKRDGVRVGDIVGAIANEAGIPGDRIGQVALFESHATVELSAEDANATVVALAQASLRGRRLSARLDTRGEGDFESERPRRDRGERSGYQGGQRSGGGGGGGDRRDFRRDERGGRDGRGEGRGEGRRDFRSEGRGDFRRDERRDDRHGDKRSFRRDDRAGGFKRDDRAGGFKRDDRGGFKRDDRRDEKREDRGRGGRDAGPFGAGRSFRSEGRPEGRSEGRSEGAREYRKFRDRPIQERVEGRREWAERGERMRHSKRTEDFS